MEPYPDTNEVFLDDALFAREMDALFDGSWVFVGADDQLAGPDSYFVYEAWGRSLLVTRDKAGELGAFVNACTHRGTRLCRGPGQGKIQCPYHGWVFGCDGKLLGASRRRGFPPFKDEDYGLSRLAIDQVGRFLFVHGRPEPPVSLRDYLGEKVATLEDLSEMLRSPLFDYHMPIAGNWKLVVSGAIEDYHVPYVHGQSLEPSRQDVAEKVCLPSGHSSFVITAPMPKLLQLMVPIFFPGQTPRLKLENHLLFPNFLLVTIWNAIHVTTFIPLGPDRSLRISRLYDTSPQRSILSPLRWFMGLLRWIAKRGIRNVYDEDRRIVEEAQIGCHAGRSMPRGPAHADEARVEHFLREAAQRLGYSYPASAGEDEGGAPDAARVEPLEAAQEGGGNPGA